MVLKNSIFLAFFGGISILLGVVRDRLLSENVGVGPMLDVYNAAFRIPDLTLAVLFSLVAGFTVVPFLTSANHDGDKKELNRRFSSLFIFFAVSMLILAGVVVLLLPFFAHLVVPGFSEEQLRLFISVTSIFMLQPLLLGLSTLISALSQVKNQFLVYSIAPLVYTGTIVYSATLYPTYGMKALIIGVIGGAVFHIVLQSYTLVRQQMFPRLSLFDFGLVKEHFSSAAPRSGSYVTNHIRGVIFAGAATTLGPGALTVVVFTQRIIDAYLQIVVQSVSTASMPRLSLYYAQGKTDAYSRAVKRTIFVILAVTILVALCIGVWRHELLTLLYGNEAPIEVMAGLLVLMLWGLPTYAVNFFFASAFSAAKNNMILFLSNLVATSICLMVLFTLKAQGYGIDSFGWAGIAMSVSYFILLMYFYNRKKLVKI